MECLDTERRDMAEQLAALQEQSGFSLGRRSARKQIERRLEEIEAQDIKESLEAETAAMQTARDALNTNEPPRSLEAEEAAVEMAKSASNRIPERLALVEQIVEAYEQAGAATTRDERARLVSTIERLADKMKGDALAEADYKARYEEQERAKAQERAEALSEKAKRAVAVLNSTTKRLARRASAAKCRRAMDAGVEPETKAPPDVQDVRQVDIKRARRDPDYAAWLRLQGLLR